MSTILEIRGLVTSFDGFRAVDGVDLTIAEGEIRFLIGPNGAGKTTLIDTVTGLVRAAAGSVRFAGKEMLGLKEYEVLHRMFRRRRGMDDTIAGALDEVGLRGFAGKPAGTLSHGQRQWLEIGMLLVQDPRVLLLDEPVAGMTAEERTRTGELLRAIALTRTLVVIEHDMDFVRRFASRVTVLHEGKVLCEGPVAEVQADPIVQEVYLGRAADRSAGVPSGGETQQHSEVG